MMGPVRRDSEFFGDLELPLLYMARRLPDALRLEELLSRHNIDYLVETGEYMAGFLMRRNLTGAYFYVAPESLETAKTVLKQNRYKPIEAAQQR